MPEAFLSKLSSTTKVDYYTKVLHGKKMFYLLLYGIIENEKLSQRTLGIHLMTFCLKHSSI